MNDIDYNKGLYTLEEMLIDDNSNSENINKEINKLLTKKEGSKLIYVLGYDYNDIDEPFNQLQEPDKLIYCRLKEASCFGNNDNDKGGDGEFGIYMATLVITENRLLEDSNGIDLTKDLKEWDNFDLESFLINFISPINNVYWEDMVMTTLEFDEILPGGSLGEIEHYKKKLPHHFQSQISQSFFYKVSTLVIYKKSELRLLIDKYCSKPIIKERELNKLTQNT